MLKLAIYSVLALMLLIGAAREFMVWYLKINLMIQLLQSIDASLKCLPAVLTEAARLRRAG